MTYQLTVQRMTLATAIFLAIALTLFLTALSGTGVALAQANDQGGNSPATGLPTITGTAQVGETLTADRSGIADEDGVTGATFSYQWVSSDGTSDTDIAGATIATYTLVSADEGQTIKVRVSFTDDADNQEMLTSAPTAAVAAPAQADSEDEPSELSYLTVVVTEDDSDPDNVFTTFTITWNDAENCSASYNAYLDGVVGDPIHLGSAASEGEQIAASLTNVSAESIGFDAKLYCGTIGSGRLVDSLMIPEYSRSFDTVPISRAYLPKPGTYSTEPGLTVLTVSSGTLTPAFHSQTLNYTVPDVANADGRITLTTTTKADYYTVAFIPGSLYFYISSCSHGGQQTSVSYQDDTGNPLYPLTDADANTPGFQMELDEGENVFKIRVWPNCESGHVYKLTVTRAANAPANTPATGAPTISGAAQVGETLTAATSGIADADGLTGATFSYQWLSSRDTEIQGATGTAYILVPGDAGKTIKVRVTFTDDEGNAETLTSAATGAVAPRPNSPATGAPTIGGTAEVGETLTADTSGIADADGLTGATFSYQWLSSRDTEIGGATSSTYTLVAADEGKTVKVKVSFTDDADNEETLTSVATTAVAGAAPAVSGAITVEVTEDYSDPINIVTNFAITWNDADVCSVDYNAYLNIKPTYLTDDETEGSQLHLGSAASDGAQITAGLTGVQGGIRGFNVELYCGTDGSGRLVSRVVIPGEYTRPRPGTYSSEPPLSALGVSHGTMTPTFQGGTSRYTVPDIANAETRITITATPKEGNFVKFFEGSGDSPVIGLIVDAWGLGPRPSGLSEDCSRGFGDHYGPLIEMTDADPDTPGFQVDLYDGTSYVWVHVYPTAVCTLGKSYALTITRAEGEISLPRPNRPAIGLPFIAPASPCVGCTMNAHVSSIKDRDGWDESTFSYQWLADAAEITGATDFSYLVADTDLGKTLKVRVSFTDGRGNEETLTSHATEVVRLRNFGPTGKPVILGTAEVGQTLRVDVSGISDPNGMTNAAFTYQWVNTPWTDSNEYTLADRDEGRRIWLRAAYTDDAGHMHVLESESTDAVAARPSSPATGAPTISGTAQVGETLTADTSGIADADGLTGATFSYQWLGSRDAEIQGATNATYTLVTADEGKAIKVRVSFTDDAGNEEALTSEPTDAVSAAPPPPPDNVRAVTQESGAVELTWEAPQHATVTGYRIERSRADENRGGQQRSDGRPRDNHTLVEDTGSADTGYTDKSAEKGVEYEYRVSARNEAGAGESSEWVRAGPESASNSPATGAPTISGTAQVGETLTAGITGIADADGLSGETFTYQWVSSDGTTDTDIEKATDSTYKLVDADKGNSIKVRVTFTDDGGNEETLTSAATGPVLGDGLPGAPRNLTATPGNKEITLSWDPPDDNGNAPATRYRIEWRVDGKDYDKNHGGTARSTTYTTNDQANLANGVKYFFRVKAGNGSGNSYGPYGPASDEVSATPTSGSAVDLDTPVLSEPEYLHHGMVQLDWQDIEDAGWYVVQYYHVKDGEWLDLPAAGVEITFHGSSAVVSNLHGLSWLRVGAASCDGASEWSQIEELYGTKESDWEGVPVPEVEEGDQTEPCPVVLGTPVLSEPEYLHHGMVQLDWQDIEDAGWYVVQYYHLEGGEWLDLPAEGVDIAFHGSSAVVSNLHGLSWLRVGAASCDGASKWSQIEQLFGTNASDWKGVPVPEVAEGDEIKPCDEDADTSDNSPATGAPTISGTVQVGETLTADTSGIADADGLSNVQYEYQWLADDADISGATNATYTLTDSEESKAITVRVGFTDDADNEETLTSAATGAVDARPNSPATGAPTIAGTAQVGQTLTADTSGIADADGLANATFSYQWLADDTDISGATGLTYTLTDSEESKAITVQVSFTDDADNEETLTSAATAAVAAKPNSPATGEPGLSFSWMTRVGETITADTSGIADADGFTNATFSYQWLADDVEIAGATGLTYTLVAADEGKAISVRVGFTDDAGHEETLTSWATGTVVAANVGLVVNTVIAEPVREGSYARVSFSVTRFTVGKEYSFAFGGVWIADNSALVWVRPMGICQAGGLDFSMDILVDSSDTVITHEGLISDRCPAGDYKLVVSWRTEDGEEEGRHLTSFQVLEDDTEVDEYSSQYVDYITPEYPDPPAEHGPFFIGLLSTAGPGWGSVIYNWGIAGVVPDSDPDTLDYVVSLRVVDDDNNPVANCNEDGVGGSYKLYTIPEDRGWGRKVTLSARCMSGAGSATFTIEFLNGSSELLLRAESPLGAARPNGDEADTPDGDDENAPLGVVINTVIAEPVQEGVGANVSVSVTGFTVGESYELSFGKVTPTNVCSVNSVDSIPVDLADYRWTINVDSSDYVWTKEGFISPRCPAGTYYLEVSYTNLNGHEKGVSSSLFSVVAALPNSPATGTPTISGTAQVGETLTANTSGVIDADGLSNVQYEYQWLASRDTEISGATGATYTVAAADEGKTIKVRVSFTDDAGNDETLTSGATEAVSAAPTPNTPATGAPSVSGTAQVGETLTANTSGIADADGLINVQYEYQWLADDSDIAGATNATYTLTDSEESKAITVQVSFTDDADNEETLTSAATGAVAGAQPTEPPAKPTGLDATASHDSVTLTWDDPGDDSITGYVILRRVPGVDPEGHFNVLVADTGTAATTYTDNTVAAETRYTYRIKAINGAGTSERSRWSHIDVPAAPVPDKPTGLEATESDGQVVLTWDDPGDDSITGYVILRRVRVNNTGGDFSVLVADTGSAATTYTDDTVAAGTTYTYRIKAINEHGTSERSRWYHIDIPEAP